MAYLRWIARDDRPILVGPFRSEVGFEALYWIPFVKWAMTRFELAWSRLIVVSRGGASAWYQPSLGGTHPGGAVDLYTLRTLDEIRLQNEIDRRTVGIQKQVRRTVWDTAVLQEAAARALGTDARYHSLHPSWMYWAFAPYWEERCGLRHIGSMLDLSPIPTPAVAIAIEGLPKAYVAVRFYHRVTFPDQPPTRAFVARLIGRIAAQMPVVLLNQPQVHADDHHDLPVTAANVIQCPAFPPERNLELMSALIGRATAFVGTYGGIAQLALRMGKPSLSFYTQWHSTAQAHLSVSQTISHVTGVPFVAMSLQEAGLCKLALRDVVAVQPVPPGALTDAVSTVHPASEMTTPCLDAC